MALPRTRFADAVPLTLLVTALLLSAAYAASVQLRAYTEDQARSRVTAQLAPYASSLTTSINVRFATLLGLHDFVTVSLPDGPTLEEFETFSAGLTTRATGIRSVQTAPGGVVTFVYPEAGNVDPGNDLLSDERPEVREDALRTRDSDHMIISGPYELRQGGLGMVGRQAVRNLDGSFWGFVTMVLDVPPVLEEAGLTQDPSGLRIAIRDDNDRVFAGDARVFDESPVIFANALPDGEWQIGAVPAAGWESAAAQGQIGFWTLASALVLALSSLTFLLASGQQRLRDQVEVATSELKRNEALLHSTFDGMMEGCTVLSPDLTYLFLNPAAIAQVRRPASELVGRRFSDVWPGIEETELYAAILHVVEARTPVRVDNYSEFLDGDAAWFELHIQPVDEGILILSEEVTEAHQMREEIEEHREHLELLVEQRTAELTLAYQNLNQVTRAKSRFLANMSHELRTPLNSIIGFSGVLGQGLAGELSEEQQRQIGMVNRSGRHLLELINGVLDLSKIEAGVLAVSTETIDCGELLTECADTLRPIAQDKSLTLELEIPVEPVEITSDPAKVRQILLNLGGNALKFTNDGAVVLRLVVEEYKAVHFEIADTGPGIPEETLDQIFEPFAQLGIAGADELKGTGLGLAISKELAELLGGEIRVANLDGGGALFSLVLPLS